ncbi:MAG TPA: hypothetical protein VFK41_12045 [Nocardioidaceae bacterium]|nr:hypothetical protein [Nocardioidaceae bacterium]
MVTRENVKLLVVIAVMVLIGSALPAAAIIANADKVDGFHAVGSGASVSARKGKLVATSKTNGRLPNNIIGTAPDAAKLGGKAAADWRTLSFPMTSGQLSGSQNTAVSLGSIVTVNESAATSWWISFMVPPTHTASTPLSLDLVYSVDSPDACVWKAETLGAVSEIGGTTSARSWFITDVSTSSPISVPAGSPTVYKQTFHLQGTVAPLSTVKFGLFRVEQLTNPCGEVNWRGVLVHY